MERVREGRGTWKAERKRKGMKGERRESEKGGQEE